jgi:hypothetical protein
MPIANKLAMYFRMTFFPLKTFAELAARPPRPLPAFGWMLLFRVPLAWATSAIAYIWLINMQQTISAPPPWLLDIIAQAPIDAGEALAALGSFPALPPLGAAWHLVSLFAFLSIVGLWMHNVVWDHTALWLLRGTKPKPSFRISSAAIAEAMGAESFASCLGAIASLSFAGFVAAPILMAANIYYWCLKGVALSFFHGCPVWKGVAATLLHVVLVILFYGLLAVIAALVVAATLPPIVTI